MLVLDQLRLSHPICIREEEGAEVAVKQMGATAVQPPPPPVLTLSYFSYAECKYCQVISAMSSAGLIFASYSKAWQKL